MPPVLIASGFDQATFIRQTMKDAEAAKEQAVRMVASRAAKELRALIKRAFGTSWRVYDAPGFAKAIQVKRMGPGWYRVQSKAVYVKGRTQPVDLLWVFDQAPVVTSGFGKGGIVIPIPGQTPLAASGRRYAWPREIIARGWQTEIISLPGRTSKLIMGRANSHEPWRPLWIWKPSVRMPRRVNLDQVFQRYADQMDTTWEDIVDGRIAKGVTRLAA